MLVYLSKFIFSLANKEQLEKFQEDIKELHKNLKMAEKAIEEKNTAIKQKDTNIQIIEEERDNKVAQLNKYKSGVTIEISELQDRINSLESEKRKLLLQVSEIEKTRDDLANSLDAHKDEQDDLERGMKNKIHDLTQENKMLKTAFEDEINEERAKQVGYSDIKGY